MHIVIVHLGKGISCQISLSFCM
uniref:Uncharacterized protein n=1 Tax=Rhizophora mucronata TaxID=61149 RepID=A0A2P2R2A8_RHIMU